jgi:alkylated DNA nucleotide flippase Atl1
MRHRLRAIQLKQWKRGKTTYRELAALGAKPEVARQVSSDVRKWTLFDIENWTPV